VEAGLVQLAEARLVQLCLDVQATAALAAVDGVVEGEDLIAGESVFHHSILG
jgi:hypothetical protein